jgi:hypothetical protein
MSAADMRRLVERVLARALARDDEAQGSRRRDVDIDGVPCVATCKARLSARGRGGVKTIQGECMVYLSCRDTESLVCGFGWMRFGIGERSISRAGELLEWALRDARDELNRHPEFIALRERALLRAETKGDDGPSRSRAKSL